MLYHNDDDRTSLHYACRISNTKLVKDLLNSGADVEDRDGLTALHSACEHGCLLTVKSLIRSGSDIHKTVNDGRTSLHMLVVEGTDI